LLNSHTGSFASSGATGASSLKRERTHFLALRRRISVAGKISYLRREKAQRSEFLRFLIGRPCGERNDLREISALKRFACQ
jgi:hypothetical protein